MEDPFEAVRAGGGWPDYDDGDDGDLLDAPEFDDDVVGRIVDRWEPRIEERKQRRVALRRRVTGSPAPARPVPVVQRVPEARPAARRPRSRRPSGNKAPPPADEEPPAPRGPRGRHPEDAVRDRREQALLRRFDVAVWSDDERDRRTSARTPEPAPGRDPAPQADLAPEAYWSRASAPPRTIEELADAEPALASAGAHYLHDLEAGDKPSRPPKPKRPREVLRGVGRLPRDLTRDPSDGHLTAVWIAGEMLKRTCPGAAPATLRLVVRPGADPAAVEALRGRLRAGVAYLAARGLELVTAENAGVLTVGPRHEQLELGA